MNSIQTLIFRIQDLPDVLKVVEINNSNLPNDIKEFLKSYYGPIIYLKDRELCDKIKEHRFNSPIVLPDYLEYALFAIAYKSPQYHRFFNHIIFSYSKEIYSVNDSNPYNCCICFDQIYGAELNSENLAYSSTGTGTCICKRCLTQLMGFVSALTELNDQRVLNLIKNGKTSNL